MKKKENPWDAYGYCVLTSRLGWLKRTQPNSPEIPELEERIPQLEADLRRRGLWGTAVIPITDERLTH